MTDFIAALDQGTTSTRCIIFNRSGVVAMAQKAHRQIFPQPGWVEHDPIEIATNSREVIDEAIARAGATPADLAGIGITNQRETVVAWNRVTGRPYANAIVWQDTRTRELCDQLADGAIDRFRPCTGLPISTYFSGPKFAWLTANLPELTRDLAAGTALLGTIDSWLVWNLTGGIDGGRHITDVTNASRTMLMNIRTLNWDAEMARQLGIPIAPLPAIVPSSAGEPLGVARVGPNRTEIPILSILGDQQAALLGQNCRKPGECKSTLGTGCFILLNTGSTPVFSTAGLLTTVAYKFGDQPAAYALEGSIAVAGALFTWLRDQLGLAASIEELDRLARAATDNGGVYFVPAFSGLLAPHWRSDARGIIIGLTQHTNRAHIARAALEATVFQTGDVLAAMHHDLGRPIENLRVDGGMAQNDLLMQLHADLLDLPILRPRIHETTALGAAAAAGVACGFWSSHEAAAELSRPAGEWRPALGAAKRAASVARWKKAVDRAGDWL